MEKWLPEVPGTLAEFQGEIRLVGSKCASCRRVYFPPLRICPDCLDDRQPLQSVFLSKAGLVSSYSVAQVAPPGYPTPHVQAYVELPEGVTIFSLMVEHENGVGMANNMPVEMVLKTVGDSPDGAKLLSYRFKPALPKEQK